MPRQNFNSAEMGAAERFDRKSSFQESIPESSVTRSPEEALHAEIELLVQGFTQKERKMQERILHDLHLAQHGTKEQADEARLRLAKAGVQKSWPVEVLNVVEGALKDSRLQVQNPDYAKDDRYKAFHDLFKDGKNETIQ